MMDYLVYEAKVAVGLLVFYLFYRFLLKKETFHRLNRAVLVGTVVLSFALPLCIITIHRPAPESGQILATAAGTAPEAAPVAEKAAPWWPTALYALFWAGAAFVLLRVVISILSIARIVRQGTLVQQEDGYKVVVTDRDIDPFSWMRYIVLSRKDWEGDHTSILAHEKAHIAYGHSAELLLVDVLSALQWFNPAVWMLRSDLQELHEYEADDAVLRAGTPIKDYQYLLIRKAVGKSGYSVANSFNHSILKNRITMMSKSKSPLSRGLRVLYVLPLVFLALSLNAQTVYDSTDKVNEKDGKDTTTIRIRKADGVQPIYILRTARGEEKEITEEELRQIDKNRIEAMTVYKGDLESTTEKYGERAKGGVIVVTLRPKNELDPIYVVSEKEPGENKTDTTRKLRAHITGSVEVEEVKGEVKDKTEKKNDDGPVEFFLLNPDTMPTFQGEDMNGFAKWLYARLQRPKDCKHEGYMKVAFTIGEDGNVEDVKIVDGICDELDSHVVSLVEKSPKWEPATTNGHPVRQRLVIPITFRSR